MSIIKKNYGLYRNGVFIYFDAYQLYKYIMLTGDMKDPITKTYYTKHELMRLDRLNNKPFKISNHIEEMKQMFVKEQERISIRNHILEEYNFLFNQLFENILLEHFTFILFVETKFLPLFIQVRESSKRICTEEEVLFYKKCLLNTLKMSLGDKEIDLKKFDLCIYYIYQIC